MKFRKASDEVLYADTSVVGVDREFVDFLKDQARRNARKRIRLCVHRDVRDQTHEMIIVHMSGTYVRPHKHLNKIESFHVIEGNGLLVLFDEKGDVTRVVPMGTRSSGRCFYHRLSRALYHTLMIYSDYFVFHETTGGPFIPEETVFPEWAPEEDDSAGVGKFTDNLTGRLRYMV